jgi:hypothetical protein
VLRRPIEITPLTRMLTTETYFPVVCSSSMNNLGPFGLLAIAVGVAAVFVLVGATPVLVCFGSVAYLTPLKQDALVPTLDSDQG